MGDYNRKESYIGNDTSPVLVDTLASNLDVSTFDIVSSSNRNIDLTPNGTGVVNVTGAVTASGNITINTGSSGLPAINLSHSNANADNFQITAGTPGVANSGFSIRDVDASANRLVINTSGNIGIGTNSPETNLHVNGNAAFKSGSNYTAYFAGGGAATLYHNGTQSLQTATSGGVNISGRVMIGTTTEGVDTGEDFTIADAAHCGMTIRSGNSSNGNIYFSDGTSGTSEYMGLIRYEHANDAMFFSVNNNERMRIDSTGDVGIGNNAPEYKLHIEGTNVSSGGGLATMCVNDTGTAYNGTNPGGGITFRGKHNSSGSTTNFATVQGIKENTSDGNYASAIRLLTRANGGNLSEKLRIGSSGEIGLSGTNFGTSGQVLTSGGSGAAPSWTTISGGGGGGGGGSGGGYDWEHISDEHSGGGSIGGSGGSGHTGTWTPIDISSYKNIIAVCTDYSTSRTASTGPWALCTNSGATAGVGIEGYAYHFYWALSTMNQSYTGNSVNGLLDRGRNTTQSAPNIMYMELRGLDQSKVFFKCQVSQYFEPMWSMGYGFTTSGSSTWYLDILNNIQAWSIVGSK